MKCIFCGPKATTFKKIEHIIPESLGNKDLILKGVVCDKCNSYFSELENYFIHHHFSSAVRLLALKETKKGKPPMQNLPSGSIRRKTDGGFVLDQIIKLGEFDERISISSNEKEEVIRTSYSLEDTDSRLISRVLAKCAIETIYFKKGKLAFSSTFDLLRQYARYGEAIPFVPFLWRFQNERKTEIMLGEFKHKSYGIFFFCRIFVPGSEYFIPCHRLTEMQAFDMLADNYSLNKVTMPEMIKRKPVISEIRTLKNVGSQKSK